MASCPNCGFDLAADGTCRVCGYGKTGPEAAGPAKKKTSPRRLRLPLIIGAFCVLVAAGAVVLAERANGSQPAPTASAGSAVATSAANQNATSTGSSGGSTTVQAADVQPTSQMAAQPAATANTHPANVEDSPYFHVAVGASPLAVRAAQPLVLYDPATQPVFNIDTMPYPPLTSEDAYVAWMQKRYPTETAHFLRWRWQRASIALARHRITHQRVLEAFLLTPREWFVRKFNLDKTYSNTAIPIGFGQTISGPDLVSNMTNALDPQPDQRVLEIGTGSGYQSAFLSSLSNYCYTIEIVRPLAEQTNQIYLDHTKELPQLGNIHRMAADGYYGWPKYAPFDRIIVTTGIDHIPPVLLRELKPGGIMVIPVGPPTGQVVLKITKTVDAKGDVHITREDIYHGSRKEIFVPFTAATGGTHNVGEGK